MRYRPLPTTHPGALVQCGQEVSGDPALVDLPVPENVTIPPEALKAKSPLEQLPAMNRATQGVVITPTSAQPGVVPAPALGADAALNAHRPPHAIAGPPPGAQPIRGMVTIDPVVPAAPARIVPADAALQLPR